MQSLLPKLPDICADIDHQFSFDVFILSETWLSPNTPDRLISVSGYKIVRQDRPRRGRLASVSMAALQSAFVNRLKRNVCLHQ